MNTQTTKQALRKHTAIHSIARGAVLAFSITTLSISAMEESARPVPLHITPPRQAPSNSPRLTPTSLNSLHALVSSCTRAHMVESDLRDIAKKAQQDQLAEIQDAYKNAKTHKEKQILLATALEAQAEIEQKEIPLYYMVDCIGESGIDKKNGDIDLSGSAQEIIQWATRHHPNQELKMWVTGQQAKLRPQSTPPSSHHPTPISLRTIWKTLGKRPAARTHKPTASDVSCCFRPVLPDSPEEKADAQ